MVTTREAIVFDCTCNVCGAKMSRLSKPLRCWARACGSPNWDRPKDAWRKPGRPPAPETARAHGAKRKARAKALQRAKRLNETVKRRSPDAAPPIIVDLDFLDQ
jgi:hypothetical protein